MAGKYDLSCGLSQIQRSEIATGTPRTLIGSSASTQTLNLKSNAPSPVILPMSPMLTPRARYAVEEGFDLNRDT